MSEEPLNAGPFRPGLVAHKPPAIIAALENDNRNRARTTMSHARVFTVGDLALRKQEMALC